jgi:hypothetical protein
MPEAKIIREWVTALRSGEYQQARNTLHRIEANPGAVDEAQRTEGMCCLGVLCDLAVKAGVIPEPGIIGHAAEQNGRYAEYEGDCAFLPETVRYWAGLAEVAPRVNVPTEGIDGVDYESRNLPDLNDLEGYGFDQIADLIEGTWLADSDAGQPA